MNEAAKKYYAVLALPNGETVEIPVQVTAMIKADHPFKVDYDFFTPAEATIVMDAALLRLRTADGQTFALRFVDDAPVLFAARGHVASITVAVELPK